MAGLVCNKKCSNAQSSHETKFFGELNYKAKCIVKCIDTNIASPWKVSKIGVALEKYMYSINTAKLFNSMPTSLILRSLHYNGL